MRVVVGCLIFAGGCVVAAFILRALGKRDKARRKAALERLLAEAHAEPSSMRVVSADVPTTPPEPRPRAAELVRARTDAEPTPIYEGMRRRYATGALLSPEQEAAHRARRARLLDGDTA